MNWFKPILKKFSATPNDKVWEINEPTQKDQDLVQSLLYNTPQGGKSPSFYDPDEDMDYAGTFTPEEMAEYWNDMPENQATAPPKVMPSIGLDPKWDIIYDSDPYSFERDEFEEKISESLKKHYNNSWASKLKNEDREAFKSYTTGFFRDINSILRGNFGQGKHGILYQGQSPESIEKSKRIAEKYAIAMEKALAKASTPFPMVVFRYTDSSTLTKNWETYQPGGQFIDMGFTSASLKESEAQNFAHDARIKYKLVIYVPRGAQAAYLDAQEINKLQERELLFQAGTPMTILDKAEQTVTYANGSQGVLRTLYLEVDLYG